MNTTASFSVNSTLQTLATVIGEYSTLLCVLTNFLVFSEQLKTNYNLGKYYVEVDFADLKTFNEETATKLAHYPNKFMPEVSGCI